MRTHVPMLRRYIAAPELETSAPMHQRAERKADRVLEAYRTLDAVLVLHVRK